MVSIDTEKLTIIEEDGTVRKVKNVTSSVIGGGKMTATLVKRSSSKVSTGQRQAEALEAIAVLLEKQIEKQKKEE